MAKTDIQIQFSDPNPETSISQSESKYNSDNIELKDLTYFYEISQNYSTQSAPNQQIGSPFFIRHLFLKTTIQYERNMCPLFQISIEEKTRTLRKKS